VDKPSVPQKSPSLESSQPSLTRRGAWSYPDFPPTLPALLASLETPHAKHPAPPEAKALYAALKKLGVHGESVEAWQAIKAAWGTFREHEFERHIGSLPPYLAGIKPILREWSQDYHQFACQQRLLPAARPQDDWRYQSVQWVQAGMKGDRPSIPQYRLLLPLIPEWVPHQTFLALLPAPGMEPDWLPGVVHFPAAQEGPVLNRPLVLHGLNEMVLEVDGLQSIAFTPASESSREWLLRWATLQGASYIVAL